MTSKAVQLARAIPDAEPQFIWAWNGLCLGYRLGASFFTCEGIELGRFSGPELFGANGRYLGELRVANDGERLITNAYKKSRTSYAFVPAVGKALKRPRERSAEPLYCGHEHFPVPEMLKSAGKRR